MTRNVHALWRKGKDVIPPVPCFLSIVLAQYSKFHEVDLAVISQFQYKHEDRTYESFFDQRVVQEFPSVLTDFRFLDEINCTADRPWPPVRASGNSNQHHRRSPPPTLLQNLLLGDGRPPPRGRFPPQFH
jgi:hypothetical protein